MGMKPMGFALEEIREVLELLDEARAEHPAPEVWSRLEEYAALAVQRHKKYRRRIALAASFTDRLQAFVASGRPARRG